MPRANQQDLEDALGVNIVKAIFDDDHDGVADANAITACLKYGAAQVQSFIDVNYPSPIADSDLLKFAEIDFCCAYATRRRPDIVKAMGEQPWVAFAKSAVDHMTRVQKNQQRLPAPAVPANVGVTSSVRGVVQPDCEAKRVWDDMGDF